MDKHNSNTSILRAAFLAWLAGSNLRARRQRNKRFTYGDQWIDTSIAHDGRAVTDWERYSTADSVPITNNILRQLVKTIVGRFRSRYLQPQAAGGQATASDGRRPASSEALLNELDSRMLEEFLISGCGIQRVDWEQNLLDTRPVVSNVNVNDFFINSISDPFARDCEIIGQIHDLSVAALIKRVAGGQRRKAAWVRRLYSNDADGRAMRFATAIGADSKEGSGFWFCPGSKCRAIEVWTLESHEVMVAHNRKSAQVTVEPISHWRQLKGNPDLELCWDIATAWHCRWFSPMGDLLHEYDTPFAHASHPFVVKMYPLTDGEVHSFIEDVIDQQKYVNRLVTLVDQIMNASAKGVLLYPDNAMPGDLTLDEVKRIWESSHGVLPYSTAEGMAKPEQISANNTNIGAYEMLNLQMKLLEEITGVNGALQGKNINTGGSVTLYQEQVDNSSQALTDIFDTFNDFRRQRTRKLELLQR